MLMLINKVSSGKLLFNRILKRRKNDMLQNDMGLRRRECRQPASFRYIKEKISVY